MDRTLEESKRHGEFIGLIHCSKKGASQLKTILESIPEDTLKTMRFQDLANTVSQTQPIHICYVQGGWIDVNTMADLHLAGDFHA